MLMTNGILVVVLDLYFDNVLLRIYEIYSTQK